MNDVQQAAFLLDGVAYPMPATFRLADPVLIKEVTGLEWEEFDARYRLMGEKDERGETPNDPIALLGIIAVAVWQKQPTWKRDRVVQFVQQVDLADLDSIAPPKAEVVPVPPADGGAHESQNGSANSNDDAGDPVTTPHEPGRPLSHASTD
jgi:hypothetical protein